MNYVVFCVFLRYHSYKLKRGAVANRIRYDDSYLCFHCFNLVVVSREVHYRVTKMIKASFEEPESYNTSLEVTVCYRY